MNKDIRKILYLIEEYKLSQNTIIDFYKNIRKQIELLLEIKKFKSSFNKKFFWNKHIKEQIKYLGELQKNLNQLMIALMEICIFIKSYLFKMKTFIIMKLM